MKHNTKTLKQIATLNQLLISSFKTILVPSVYYNCYLSVVNVKFNLMFTMHQNNYVCSIAFLRTRIYHRNEKCMLTSLCPHPAVLQTDITNGVLFSPPWSLYCCSDPQ